MGYTPQVEKAAGSVAATRYTITETCDDLSLESLRMAVDDAVQQAQDRGIDAKNVNVSVSAGERGPILSLSFTSTVPV